MSAQTQLNDFQKPQQEDAHQVPEDFERMKLHFQLLPFRHLSNPTEDLEGVFAHLRTPVLILCGGDLSFSVALAFFYPEVKIVATVPESHKQFIKKYDTGLLNLYRMHKFCQNVQVKFSIDPVNVRQSVRVDHIIFADVIINFDTYLDGTSNNYEQQRNSLQRILKFLSQNVIMEGSTRLHAIFRSGQSGIDANIIRNQVYFRHELFEHDDDSLQVLEIAAMAGLRAERVQFVPFKKFPGYKSPNQEKCIQHKYDGMPEMFTFMKYALSFSENMEEVEEELYSLIQEIAGPLVVNIREVHKLRKKSENKLNNRLYHIFWQGWQIPLSKEMFDMFASDLCYQLQNAFEANGVGIKILYG
ncbi:hypothetical protein DdX_02413 [Ditylenchus destructor]|uniref:25S rRNA (uridine-N(3))-methyltransferase BMT5-like domain-containing protein n=1 Tax=Ditylenchus destructor TaxID=166010 RepID=A0AAD4NHK6_9BILA|nr:hypothetical protein DdX_02413 [Ditylenchus destructor]